MMLKGVSTELHVSDCEAAAHFFEDAIGFRRGYSLNEGGKLDFVVIEHPDAGCELLLHQMLPASQSAKPREARLLLHVSEIEKFCESIRSKGYDVSSPAVATYGAVTATMAGPDGYVITLQEWKTGVSA